MLSSLSSEFAKNLRCQEPWGHQRASLALSSPSVGPHPCTLPMDKDSHFSLAQGRKSLPKWCCRSTCSQPCLWMAPPCSLSSSSVCAPISFCSWLGSLDGPWTWITTLPSLGLLVDPITSTQLCSLCLVAGRHCSVSKDTASAGVTYSSVRVTSRVKWHPMLGRRTSCLSNIP